MSTFKTKSEISAASEFVQYLEQVKSGSLAGNVGINRALERLALNLDAVLDALQGARMSFLVGGGSISFSSNTLTWSSDLEIYFPGEIGSVRKNIISAGSASTLTDGKILYVVLDRATDAAIVAPVVTANMLTFLATVAGSANRLDYQIIGRATADGITLFDGRRIVEGYALNSDGYVDSQYGQQTELTTVHNNQKENFRLMITGGGNISWDLSTTQFSWDAAFILEFPSATGSNRILAASSPVSIPAGQVMYLTLSRNPGGIVNLTPTVAAIGAVPTGDDIFVFAIHKSSDGRLYLCNGQALSDAETLLWGGVRTGTQWFFSGAGAGTQVTDFTVGGSFPSRSYRVGADELLVFRNGVKARPSTTGYWSGTYPAGSLVGTIGADDWYLEENASVGTGTRVIWLRDNTGDTAGHLTNAHDPTWAWPQTSDYIEAFIGIQGQGPSPVESLGIYPELGSGPLEGDVKFKAGTGVSIVYDIPNNAIQISAAATAGVATLELTGGSGVQSGSVKLVESATVEISEPATAQFQFDVKSPYKDGLTSSTVPSTTNPYSTFDDFVPISGFDPVWCTDSTPQAVYTGGGILRSNGVAYRSFQLSGNFGRVEFSDSNVYGSDVLVSNTWNYAYLYPATVAGRKPRGVISVTPPDATVAFGTHPSDATYKFLTSVFVSGTGVKAFIKRGSWVDLGFEHDITPAFGIWAGPSGSLSIYNLMSFASSGYIPATTKHLRVRLRLGVTASAGDRVEIRVRTPGFGSYKSYFALVGNSPNVDFLVDLLLDTADSVDISSDADISTFVSAFLLSYAEGRETAALNMGA